MDPDTAVWLRNGFFSWKRSHPDAMNDTLNSGVTESDVTLIPDCSGPSCSGEEVTESSSHDLPSNESSDVDGLLSVDRSHLSCLNLESSQNHSDEPRTLCLENISVSIKKVIVFFYAGHFRISGRHVGVTLLLFTGTNFCV